MLSKLNLVGPSLLVLIACGSTSSGSGPDELFERGAPGPGGTPALQGGPAAPAEPAAAATAHPAAAADPAAAAAADTADPTGPTATPSAPAPGAGSGAGEGSGSGAGLGLAPSSGTGSGSTGGSSASTSGTGGSTSERPVEPLPSPGALIRGDAPTLESATSSGEFEVETFTEGLRNGPDYGTQTLHFPVDAEPPFAAVAVVPGFTAPESSIRTWGPFLASHGIVTLTIGTNSPTDSPDARANALLDALQTLTAENARPGSPLEGKIDTTRLGVMGWSMGGGGTLIASNTNPEIRAAITMAAWSPGAQFTADQVPTLLFAGSADSVAGGQSQGFFESIPETTPKMLFEVEGGSHSVANNPSGGAGEVGRYGLSWLKVFLESDERFRQFLLQEPTRDSEFIANLSATP
jgi:dienelactone hydrolase